MPFICKIHRFVVYMHLNKCLLQNFMHNTKV